MPNTITLKAEGTIYVEDVVLAPIRPGLAIERAAGGVQPMAAPAASHQILIALEGGFVGTAPGNRRARGIDDNYTVGEQVRAITPKRGDVLWLLIETGEVLAAGARVQVGAGGTLIAEAAGMFIGNVLEAAAAPVEPVRARVEIAV